MNDRVVKTCRHDKHDMIGLSHVEAKHGVGLVDSICLADIDDDDAPKLRRRKSDARIRRMLESRSPAMTLTVVPCNSRTRRSTVDGFAPSLDHDYSPQTQIIATRENVSSRRTRTAIAAKVE